MTAQSPEQFLREFANKCYAEFVTGEHAVGIDRLIDDQAELLKLREDAARVDEHRLFRLSCYGDGESGFMQVHMKTVDERLAELTTPNNNNNSPEDEELK